MVDLVSLAVALSALATAVVGIFGYLLQRQQLASANARIEADGKKIEALGGLVTALKGMVESQKEQVAELKKMVQTLGRGLDLKQTELDIQRRESEIQAAQLAWNRMNPIDKLRLHADELVDRGKRKLRRLFGRA